MSQILPLSSREQLWKNLEQMKQMLDISNRVLSHTLVESHNLPVDIAAVLDNMWRVNSQFIAILDRKQQIIEAVIREELGLAQETIHTTSIKEMLDNAGD